MLPTPPSSDGLTRTIQRAGAIAAESRSRMVRGSHVLQALAATLGDALPVRSPTDRDSELVALIGRAVQIARDNESVELTEDHLVLAILDDFDPTATGGNRIQVLREQTQRRIPTPSFPPSDAFSRFSDHPSITPLSDAIYEAQTALEDDVRVGDGKAAAAHRAMKAEYVRRLYVMLEQLWSGRPGGEAVK